MNNLLIETSAIESFPKSSSLKLSSGSFSTSSSSPYPKARYLKRRSLKPFVLRLFGKFMPRYLTLKDRRFHFTHNLGPWTRLISNPSNALLAALKTGEIGRWLTAVARWHMRYLLRWISRRRCDRVSELCSISFALRVARCLAAVARGELYTVWYHRHTRRARHCHRPSARAPANPTSSRTHNSNVECIPFTMPGLNWFFQHTPRVIQNFATSILVRAGDELVGQGQRFMGNRTARCV